MTELETGSKSLGCVVLWLSQWKRKEKQVSKEWGTTNSLEYQSCFAHHFINRRIEAWLTKEFYIQNSLTENFTLAPVQVSACVSKMRMPLGAGLLPGERGAWKKIFNA